MSVKISRVVRTLLKISKQVHRIYCVGRNYWDHGVRLKPLHLFKKSFLLPFEFTFFTLRSRWVEIQNGSHPSSSWSRQTRPFRQQNSVKTNTHERNGFLLTITDTKIPYPTSCSNFHYECELVVAIGEGGTNIPVEDALKWAAQNKLSYISPVFIIRLRFLESYLIFRHVYGYSVGVDLTRRDLQNEVCASGIMKNLIF